MINKQSNSIRLINQNIENYLHPIFNFSLVLFYYVAKFIFKGPGMRYILTMYLSNSFVLTIVELFGSHSYLFFINWPIKTQFLKMNTLKYRNSKAASVTSIFHYF